MKARPELYKRMIAAYVIGFSVTGDYLAANPQLKFAHGPDDTGVIISYNTVNKKRGVVICSTADPNQLAPGNPALQAGIYHGFEHPLLYFDIRANAANRSKRYLANR